MDNIIAFKSKKNLIDEKHEQVTKDIEEADKAITEWNELVQGGNKPTIEQTKELFGRILKPNKSLKELHELKGEDSKSILEKAVDMTLEDYSEGELKSGFLTVEHLEEYEELMKNE